MNVLWCKMYQGAKDLVKMLAGAGKRVSLSTVKRDLYWHGPKSHSERKKPLPEKQHKKTDYNLQMQLQTKTFFLGDIPRGLTLSIQVTKLLKENKDRHKLCKKYKFGRQGGPIMKAC
ncbi:hypothetical protein ATANTOWER_014344 [Ataeniobius toweri]|uniref:Transposase n=1 Tax=Ataeniobius toweri TaxID=208326 RepID=A0ABU7A7C4_9TELE|nr:hypothetical protein [Ataeniobius toweri]